MAVFKNGIFINYNGQIITATSNFTAAIACNNFFQSASITDQQQRFAVYNLVSDLQSYNIWDKMKAIYPFVGQPGVSSSFQFNLKDPTTFKGIFTTTGWTFASTGVKGNGTSAYMDTGYNPSVESLPLNSASISIYARNNIVSKVAFGCNTAGVGSLYVVANSTYGLYSAVNSTEATITPNWSDGLGLFLNSRVNSTEHNLYQNTTKKTRTTNSVGVPNLNMYLGCYNNTGTAQQFSDIEYAFAHIGTGLTDTEAANFYTAVQRFQTTLGRQV